MLDLRDFFFGIGSVTHGSGTVVGLTGTEDDNRGRDGSVPGVFASSAGVTKLR